MLLAGLVVTLTACAAGEPDIPAAARSVAGGAPAADKPAAAPPGQEALPAHLFEGPIRKPVSIAYQAEELIALGVVTGPGEAPVAQDMTSFGAGWSGNAQLFWPAKGVGSRIVFKIPILVDARYEVDAYLTRAPDYGILQFEVGGEKLPVVFDGYAPRVEPSGKVHLGTVALETAKGSVAVRVIGRNEASSGYFAGIDRIALLVIRAAS